MTPRHIAFVLAANLLTAATIVQAQHAPPECPDTAQRVFSATLDTSVMAHVCSQVAPDTVPAFDRVLARYHEDSPACFTATRRMPELMELARSGALAKLVADFRSGVMSAERRDALLQSCRSIEASDKQARESDDAYKELVRKTGEPEETPHK